MKRGILVLLVGCAGLTASAAFGGSFPSPPLYPSFSAPRAATVTKFAPEGAQSTNVLGLTLGGTVSGNYDDSSTIWHGFIRAPNGNIATFDAPGASATPGHGTFVGGMNNKGDVVGFYFNAHGVSRVYIRAANGKFTEFTVHGSAGASGYGINDHGVVIGRYTDSQNVLHGFIRAANGTITKFDVSSAAASGAGTYPVFINDSGTIAGAYLGNDLIAHGFVRAPNGTITKFLVHKNVEDVDSINDSGDIVGDYGDKNGLHAFIRTAGGKVQSFEAPQAVTGGNNGTIGGGINSKNVIVGFYDSKHGRRGYERRADGTFLLFDTGSLVRLLPSLINDKGVIAGVANEGNRAFIRIP